MMSKSDFTKRMSSHETTFVNVAVNSFELSLSSILPHCNVTLIGKLWFLWGVLSDHDGISIYFSHQITVVEIGKSIEQRLLLVGFLNHCDECKQ